MGRKLKRVPLDFSWPLREIWSGYINNTDSGTPCDTCEETGLSPEAKLFQDQWYGYADFDPEAYGSGLLDFRDPQVVEHAQRYADRGLCQTWQERREFLREYSAKMWCYHLSQDDVDALVAADRLWDFTRRKLCDDQETFENGWTKEPNGYRPTAAEVNVWSLCGFGHDGLNQHICVKARCERENVAYLCDECDGHGRVWASREALEAYENWEGTEPPEGPGFQLWETTTEGSPISPVFESLEKLCEYAARECTTFGSARTSAEKWREMLDENFVRHEVGNLVFI